MSTNILPVVTMTAVERERLAAGAPDAGLGTMRTERGNLPLELLDVRATITGLAGAVELTQGFTNPHDQPLEATYVFPLPDRFALTGMRMTADDRTVQARLRERAAARAAYDKALAEGRRASIAEEERPDVFTMRVGNILPGERVMIALTLAGPLSYEDGEATFRFPLVVAPRYIPGAPVDGGPVGDGYAADTDAVPDASRITPPVLLPGFPHPVRLSIAVRVDPAGLPLEQARCSLPTESTADGAIQLVAGQRADQDFVLRLRYGRPVHATHALVLATDPDRADEKVDSAEDSSAEGPSDDADAAGAVSDGSTVDDAVGTFQLTLLPPTDAAPPRPRDLVLVLDRSGSMGGWKMVAARRAASRIVDTLTGADRFAVRTFDSVVERPEDLPAGLVAATDRHRFRAVEHLARAQARGGTELLTPLREALSLLGEPTAGDAEPDGQPRDRVLVLVTDGQVGNEDQILRETTAGLQGVRVHTVGIDRAVNAGFLGRLATLGGGRCELVESEDRLDEAMDQIHRRISAPLVTGLTVDSEGIEVLSGTVSPARLPALFPGAPVVLTGRYRPVSAAVAGGAAAGGAADPGPAGALVVRGQTHDGAPWQARVAGCAVADGSGVTAGWARSHLRDLEDRYASLGHGRRPGEQNLADLERRIVATSLRFHVLCRFTAYVAVDSRVVTGGADPHRVLQPVEPVAGWEMPQLPVPAGAMVLTAMARPAAPNATGLVGRRLNADLRARRQPGEAVAGFPSGVVAGGSSFGTPVAHPSGPAAQGRLRAVPAAVREQAALEAGRLRAADTAPGYERWELLDDLGTRLMALVRELSALGAGHDMVAQVEKLADAIRANSARRDETGLAKLWLWALRVLDELGEVERSGSTSGPGESGGAGGSGGGSPGAGGPRGAGGSRGAGMVNDTASASPESPASTAAQAMREPRRTAFWKR